MSDPASRTPRFVIVVPPTDHYRMYEIVGHVETFKSEPLSFGAAQNSTPCGPKCPATWYQQLPRTSGVVQHYPPLPPLKPVQKVFETSKLNKQMPAAVERRLANVANDASNINSSLPGGQSVSSMLFDNKGSTPETSDLMPSRKPVSVPSVAVAASAASVEPCESAVQARTLKFFEGCVVLKKLDIPRDYETIRIAPRDNRLKDEHDARVVVETREGRRHVTLLRGYDHNTEQASPPSSHTQPEEYGDVWPGETSSTEQVWRLGAPNEQLSWPADSASAWPHEVAATEQVWTPDGKNGNQDWCVDAVGFGSFQPPVPGQLRVPDFSGSCYGRGSGNESGGKFASSEHALQDVLDLAGFDDGQLPVDDKATSDFANVEQGDESDPHVMFYPVFGFDQLQWPQDQHSAGVKHNHLIWRPTAPIPGATLGLPLSPDASVRLGQARKMTMAATTTTKTTTTAAAATTTTKSNPKTRPQLHRKRRVVGEHAKSRRCKAPLQRAASLHARNMLKIHSAAAPRQRISFTESQAGMSGLNWRPCKPSKATATPSSKSAAIRRRSGKVAVRQVQKCRKQSVPCTPIIHSESQPTVGISDTPKSPAYQSDTAAENLQTNYNLIEGTLPTCNGSTSINAHFVQDSSEKSAGSGQVSVVSKWCRESDDPGLHLNSEQCDDAALQHDTSSIFKSAADDDLDVKRSSRRNAKRPAHLTDFYMDIPTARKATDLHS